MRSIDIKAVVLATLAVFGIDFVSGIVLFSIFADAPVNMSEDQARAVALALNSNRSYLLAALVLGTASTVLGGYLTARMARSVPYFNALAFAVLGIFLGLVLSAGLPAWFMVVGFGLTIPAALFGAYLLKHGNPRTGN